VLIGAFQSRPRAVSHGQELDFLLVQLELAGLGACVKDQVLGGHRGGEGHPGLWQTSVIAS